ncbi:MAG: SdiA-regulated domain-containing protein [Ignavibacteriales bacterium]|nr:SdiA-regulated domain-containing protein [Ignavibacteriales bacterium]
MKIKIILVAALLFLLACLPIKDDQSALSWYNVQNKKVQVISLPKELKEISGMAFTKDGRLFAHNDNKGIVYQIDFNSGSIVKSFSVGRKPLRADFEEIEIVDKKFFLVTSNGYLVEFTEGKNNSYVDFKKYDTGLTESYNIEGLCYDPETNSLLLACKDFPGPGYGNYRTVYSFSLTSNKLNKKPRFVLPVDYITQKLEINNFRPSGIRRHPISGTFFIISARDQSLIEVSRDGKIINLAKLIKHKHNQPEGIAFAPDNSLFISDEGKQFGQITKYSMEK